MYIQYSACDLRNTHDMNKHRLAFQLAARGGGLMGELAT